MPPAGEAAWGVIPSPIAIPDVSTGTKRIALLLLLLMTVGYGVYQFAVIRGLSGAFMGGYIGLMGAILFAPALFFYVREIAAAPWRFSRGDLLFALFAGMIGAFASLNYLLEGSVDIALWHMAVLPEIFVFFVAFRFIDLSSRPDQRRILAAFGVLTFLVLALALGDAGRGSEAMISTDPEDIGGYQQFGLVYFIIMTCCACFSERLAIRLLIYGVGLLALFENGSRSDMIACVLMIAVVESHFSRRSLIGFLVAGVVLLLFHSEIVGTIETLFPSNRNLSLLYDLSYDRSWGERQYYREVALWVIHDSPLFGEYGYYGLGQYSHDFLSVWADFGALGFLLFLSCLAFPLAAVVHANIARIVRPEVVAMAAFTVTGILLYAFSKAYTHPALAIMLALYASHLNARRVERAADPAPAS